MTLYYKYEAVDIATGAVIVDCIEAVNEQELSKKITAKGQFLTKIFTFNDSIQATFPQIVDDPGIPPQPQKPSLKTKNTHRKITDNWEPTDK